jgi:membrane-associated protease RseP (regulator of RpoE activity)
MIRKSSILGIVSLTVLALAVPASYGQTMLPPTVPGRHHSDHRHPYGLLSFGLEVSLVTPWSPAARAGIDPGDIIIAVNGQPTRTMAEMNRLLARSSRAARISVIDGTTGLVNQAWIQPIGGRIGVVAWPVPLDAPIGRR